MAIQKFKSRVTLNDLKGRFTKPLHVSSSKLSIKSVPHGTILVARLKGLLHKIDPAYAFLKIGMAKKFSPPVGVGWKCVGGK